MDKKGFVKIYNVFTDTDNIYKLNMKEMYLYAYLKMLQSKSNDLWVNVNFLHSIMNVKFESNPSRNKKHISDTIKSLVDKSIIECDKVKFNNKDRLLISLNDGKFQVGHEQIECMFIDNLDEYQYLYIYVVVSRYMNTSKGHLEFSYTDWSNLLHMHRTTVINYVKQCVKKEYIYSKTGGYTGNNVADRNQLKQEKNKYKNTPFTDDENSNEDKREDNKSVKVDFDKENKTNIQHAIASFKNYDNHFPDVKDYKEYLLVEDSPDTKEKIELVKAANKRMNHLKHNWNVKNGLTEAERLISNDKEMRIDELKSISDTLTSKYIPNIKYERVPIDVSLYVNGEIKLKDDCNENELNNADYMFYEELIHDGNGHNYKTKSIKNPKPSDLRLRKISDDGRRWLSNNDYGLYNAEDIASDPSEISVDDIPE